MMTLTLPTDSYLFARVRLAYSAVYFFGNLVMPPVATIGGYNRNYSYNRGIIYKMSDNHWPVVNARPIANGAVTLKLVRVVCGDQGS
jgi:hypothetical protein